MKKVSKRNHRGETPLHCSAIKVGPAQAHPALATAILTQGNVAMVRKLLRMGADPNTQDNAGTASSQLWPCLDVGKLVNTGQAGPRCTRRVTAGTCPWRGCCSGTARSSTARAWAGRLRCTMLPATGTTK